MLLSLLKAEDDVSVTCNQAFFFFFGRADEAKGKKITPSSRERHKEIIGRGHGLRLIMMKRPFCFKK